jgi:hypothetical protein
VILVDSDVLIVNLRGEEAARDWLLDARRVGLGDFLIAATADVEGLDLATLNVRHFPMIDGLEAPFQLS